MGPEMNRPNKQMDEQKIDVCKRINASEPINKDKEAPRW